ncbi:PepSY domain-containing protein [Bacillus spongiae]|uniref:PepSY domain-containing protein n=1 Tax=Bacillus spongiae TaxID=2683610 RepID=A0ABU8HHG3_9BACI
MNWKPFLIGAAVGITSVYLLRESTKTKTYISSEKVLQKVKDTFKAKGPINGSWIHMEPENYEITPMTSKIYRGGISRHRNGNNEHYEFIADAHTGTIMDISLIKN